MKGHAVLMAPGILRVQMIFLIIFLVEGIAPGGTHLILTIILIPLPPPCTQGMCPMLIETQMLQAF
uniref:Uncharacterized protein n=1 Tax=Rhizophora mucronata TaxID=61149 RepID=A0A2P2N366_RHIMU